MATPYFWVGGSGTWDGTDTTHWALTSGTPDAASYRRVDDFFVTSLPETG